MPDEAGGKLGPRVPSHIGGRQSVLGTPRGIGARVCVRVMALIHHGRSRQELPPGRREEGARDEEWVAMQGTPALEMGGRSLACSPPIGRQSFVRTLLQTSRVPGVRG